MTIILNDRSDFTLDAFERVAFDGEDVRFTPHAIDVMTAAHEAFQHYCERNADGFIYGVTSGGGPDARKRYTLSEARQRRGARRWPWQGLAFGGPPLPEYVARGSVFAALTMFIEGNTATAPARAEAVAGMLADGLPSLPSRGLVAAGELMPNFVLFHGRATPSGSFSAGSGNGSQTSTAMAASTAILARRRLELAAMLFALSIEAFNAPLEAYDCELDDLWGDPHEARALTELRGWLDGVPTDGRRPYQAPVSYRILPRVLGQAYRALAALEEVAETSLQAIASNPTYVPPAQDMRDDRAFSTGGYHNAMTAPAIDAMAASWADLGSLAHRHIVKLHKGDVSLLPDRLLPEGTDYTTGYSTTYIEYVPNDFVEEMRRIAQPTLLTPAEIAASEQDDVAIPTPLAFRMERQVTECFDATLTVLAVVTSQALHRVGRLAPPRLAGLLTEVRGLFPPVETRRPLGEECERLSRAFTEMIEHGRSSLVNGNMESPTATAARDLEEVS